jgi:prepilin-type N-terminal cleavage/methylation domain-containing protein
MNKALDRPQAGFSMIELLVAIGVLLAISSVVTSGLLQMTQSERTIWNRTEMHSGVRSATELLQQEVGQAGRVALPGVVTLTAAVAAAGATVNVSSTAGMFVNELLVVDTGANQETVLLTAIAGNQITASAVDNLAHVSQASFAVAHNVGAVVAVFGGFKQGIIPDNVANGSDQWHLKLFGDINGDGAMVYVEYFCDTAGGNLYRTMVAWNAANKPAPSAATILLSNVKSNPANAACFLYQRDPTNAYVLDVAVTLTVETQQVDPITKVKQQETKALLNISPRNVVGAWSLHGAGYDNRVQPTPANITNLLPPPAL